MHIEHLIFSFSVAIIIGMLYRWFTGRELSWIIILSAFAPDLDVPAEEFRELVFNKTGTDIQIFGVSIEHGDFHNVGFLILYALTMAVLLYPFGLKFFDVFIFSAVGFGAHLLEDALVFSSAYGILWNLTPFKFGTGIYYKNFYGIADINVLIWGGFFLGIAVALRTICQRKNWLSEMFLR